MKPYHRKNREEAPQTPPVETPPARTFGAPPEPDIPELKKQEEERKGAGVPWYGGTGAGAPGLTLGGMGGGSQVGASLSGRIAAALANLFGGPGTFLGGLFASQMGANLVLAGLLSWGAVLALAGYTLWNGMGGRARPASPSFPVLDGVGSSGIMIERPKDRSLDYVGKANQGEVVWDKENPMAPKDAKEEPKKEAPAESKVEPPKTPQFQMPNVNDLLKQKGLDPNGFVKKMTQDPSSLRAGGGAGAGPALKDGQSGFNLTKTFTPGGVGARQKLAPLSTRKKSPMGVRTLSTQRASSSRAMGQLKFATDMSKTGSYSASDVPSKSFATAAFEQGKPQGGDMLGITDPGGVVVPAGGVGDTPIPDLGSNVTPYQPQVDAAKSMGNSSSMLMAAGLAMLAMGIMMIVTGIGLLNCTTFPIGLALIAAGMALMMVGIMLLAMSAMMNKQANNQAQNVGAQQGQQEQQTDAQLCIAILHANPGKTMDQVCPNGQPPLDTSKGNNVQQDVQKESQSTYKLSN